MCERERRAGMTRDDQLHVRRKESQPLLKEVVDLRAVDVVKVVEHEPQSLRARQRLGDVVAEVRDDLMDVEGRRGVQIGQQLTAEFVAERLQRSNQREPKTLRNIVVRIEGDPRDRKAAGLSPVVEEGAFAETAWRANDRQGRRDLTHQAGPVDQNMGRDRDVELAQRGQHGQGCGKGRVSLGGASRALLEQRLARKLEAGLFEAFRCQLLVLPQVDLGKLAAGASIRVPVALTPSRLALGRELAVLALI